MASRSTGGTLRMWTIGLAAAVALAGTTVGAAAQNGDAEAQMIAAGRWASSQVPGQSLRLDPHRSGRSTDVRVAERVAASLGGALGTLEETRTCTDPMAPSSCRLAVDRLLAISPPRSSGDAAEVRVYAWFRQDSAREPVGRRTWDVSLRRTADGWEVSGHSVRR